VFGVALLLAACSGGDGDEGETGATDTTLVSMTTSSPPAPRSSTTSTSAPPACPTQPPNIASGDGTALDADVDGDGRVDRVSTVPDASGGTHLVIHLAAGGQVVEDLPPTGDPASLLATHDIDGNGTAELLVEQGRGASTRIVGLYRLDVCDLEAVQLEGTGAEFAIGGPVLLLQGLRCEDDRLVHLGATSEDGETFATLDLVYELRGGDLVLVDDRSGELTAADPALEPYSRFDC
jgi:hypothetical protein